MTKRAVDRADPAWFVFGEHPDGKTVDIADGEGDVFQKVDRATAEAIVAARERFRDALFALPDETPFPVRDAP